MPLDLELRNLNRTYYLVFKEQQRGVLLRTVSGPVNNSFSDFFVFPTFLVTA
jgi:hypothetical protein